MKNTNIFLLASLIVLLASCGQESGTTEAKKKELEEARKEYQALKDKIDALEGELKELDPEFAKEADKSVLVSAFTAKKMPFEHRIEARGAVASRKNVMISAETNGAIARVHVSEGQRVSKGQVLVTIDADIIRNNIAELKTALELADVIYGKQSRLWEQKIGTEVQYLEAKNRKESLERQLATAQSQLAQAIVRAPFSGTVDAMEAREGEMAMAGAPLVRIMSPLDTYIKADVSERYIGKLSKGDEVEVYFPVQDARLKSTISAVSQVINSENRTFSVEVRMPRTDLTLKPNQVAILLLRDYYAEDAYVVPTKLIQVDGHGKYIYEVKTQEDKKVARKLYVKTGLTYDGNTEIVEGIAGGETLVSEGFRDLSNDVEVAISSPVSPSKDLAKKIN